MSPNEMENECLLCGFVKIDKNRLVVDANPYALNLLSCESVDAIVGLNIKELMTFATHIFLDSYVYPMLLNEGKAEEIQLGLKPIMGVSVPIVANIQMGSDQVTYWTFMGCINRDQLYNELLTARDTLHSQAQSLSNLNVEIEERQSELQAFCQSLSHDFTGPLYRIRRLIEVAVEDLKEGGIEAPEEYKLLSDAQKNTETLTEMTKGLVAYLVADVPVSLDEEVDLEEIVSTVLTMREEQDSTLPKIHRTFLPTLVGSKAQIQVLFKNLIENAIKYNENDPEITISYIEDVLNDKVVISIKDNGIGMSGAYLESIFTPFTRLHTAAQYQGSGLGLSIVKKMVMNHGGDIRVESTPGSGSTFYVSLPFKAVSYRSEYQDA